MDLAALIAERPLLLDGGLGRALMERGFAAGECPEEWNVSHPAEVANIHRAFFAAGSDIVNTNTFGGTAMRLEAHGLSARAVELMRTRATTMEAAGEASGPAASLARMADCFGAPVLLVFGFEDCLADAGASYDTASLVQNVCLAAHDKGLGTCQSTTLVRYAHLLRDALPGSAEKKMVVAVTLGWPDAEDPANTFARSRAPLDELVTWVS